LDELFDDPPLQWPSLPKDRQEHRDGFRELVDSSIWPKSMNQPDSFEQPRSSPPSHAQSYPDKKKSRYHGTTPRIKLAIEPLWSGLRFKRLPVMTFSRASEFECMYSSTGKLCWPFDGAKVGS
jgi:hypothetical protein